MPKVVKRMVKRVDNHLEVNPPKKPKKITGTRFASILGLNRWSTPFEAWCAITRTYEVPFEETVYTKAGKAIEPLQIDFMRKHYAMDVKTPEDEWGKDFFQKTWGDFYPDNSVFGGMWDAILREDGEEVAILEMKTTKRAEDWLEGTPEYYAMQGALYAYLLGIPTVIMVCSFLEPRDYEHPEQYVCTVDNTITDEFDIYERFPDFDARIEEAHRWWENHVETGISPDFDEKNRTDAEIIKALLTVTVQKDDLSPLIEEAEALMDEIEEKVGEQEKRLTVLKDAIKEYLIEHMDESDKEAVACGKRRVWTVTKGTTSSIDKKALEADGLLDKYTVSNERFTFRNKEVGNE